MRYHCESIYLSSMFRWLATIMLLTICCAGNAQNGWLSVSGTVHHSYYRGNYLSEITSPTLEFGTNAIYSQMFGKDKDFGVWFGWNYGRRSLSRTETYGHTVTEELEFTYIENALMIGISLAHKKTDNSKLQYDLGIGRFMPHGSWLTVHRDIDGVVTESDSKFSSPARTGMIASLRYSRRAKGGLWIFCSAYFLAVKPPTLDYIAGSPSGQKYISIGEARGVLGIAFGVEFGPLFNGEQQKP